MAGATRPPPRSEIATPTCTSDDGWNLSSFQNPLKPEKLCRKVYRLDLQHGWQQPLQDGLLRVAFDSQSSVLSSMTWWLR